MAHRFTLPSFILVLFAVQSTFAQIDNNGVTVPKASYVGVMPESTGGREFISVYVKNNQVHVSYKKIHSLLDSVNTFRDFYCRMIQLADTTDAGFSIANSYISLYIDTSVSFTYLDYVLEELKQAGLSQVLLKTQQKKMMNAGFYIPMVQVPEKRMSYVSRLYGKNIIKSFDRYKCLYANDPVIITDDDPNPPPPPPPGPPPTYPPYLNDDIVRKYKQSLSSGIDSAYQLVTWKNNKVHMNNTPYEVHEVTRFIERNPKAILLIEITEKQKYPAFIKLMDHLMVSYYMVVDDYCQKKFKKSMRDINHYALREIEKVIPFRYYILSRAELLYVNDVDE